MARSRPQTVSVRRWLVLRAASTLLASPCVVIKLGQARRSIQTEWGRERWRMGTSAGSWSQVSKSPCCAPPWCAPVRPLDPASWPSKLARSWQPPCRKCYFNLQHFFRRTAPSRRLRSGAAEKMRHPSPVALSISCRRRAPRQRLRVYATGGRASGQSWRPGSPALWPCRTSSPCA
jgi:hypothetical protein